MNQNEREPLLTDLIEINAGGSYFTTLRGTLVGQHSESCGLKDFFETLLANPRALRDQQGRLFLDVDGSDFGSLLNHLRGRPSLVANKALVIQAVLGHPLPKATPGQQSLGKQMQSEWKRKVDEITLENEQSYQAWLLKYSEDMTHLVSAIAESFTKNLPQLKESESILLKVFFAKPDNMLTGPRQYVTRAMQEIHGLSAFTWNQADSSNMSWNITFFVSPTN
jgi:hypothetical protein